MTTDEILILVICICVGLYFTFQHRFAFRSPKIFQHGGVYVKVWDKWYRVFAVEDPRMKRFRGDADE
jgi:hypothetical protein